MTINLKYGWQEKLWGKVSSPNSDHTNSWNNYFSFHIIHVSNFPRRVSFAVFIAIKPYFDDFLFKILLDLYGRYFHKIYKYTHFQFLKLVSYDEMRWMHIELTTFQENFVIFIWVENHQKQIRGRWRRKREREKISLDYYFCISNVNFQREPEASYWTFVASTRLYFSHQLLGG